MATDEFQEILTLTKRLVTCNSDAAHPEKIHESHLVLKEYLEKNATFPLEVELLTEERSDGGTVESLYAYNPEAAGQTILLLGHNDIIPIDSEKQLVATEEDGWLHGRGTGDMKAGVAINTLLFLKHGAAGKDVRLFVAGDEELGGPYGARPFAERHAKEFDFVIATEPSGLLLKTREKGGIWIEIIASGPGGHASRPWVAENAADTLLNVYNRLRERYKNPDQEEWVTTMNLGAIYGGKLVTSGAGNESTVSAGGANAIAKHAVMRLDCRLGEQTHEELVASLKEAVAAERAELDKRLAARGLNPKEYSLEVGPPLTDVPHLKTADDDPFVVKLADAFRDVVGEEPKLTFGSAASDARFFSKAGVPCVIFGPKSIGHHSTDERVELATVKTAFEVMDAFLEAENE